ncbi:unnamed protein product [Hymenolepis diminuta]|uniref:Uncharacterized protein n=1 Tax=Hymenolepis diminuta TaxID=6216 RepID=A0A564YSM8_HYMDI|nr:unnamed protein product [Hymenolepis diminuta]
MVRSKQSVQGTARCNSKEQKLYVKRSCRELESKVGPLNMSVQTERTRKQRSSIDRGDPFPIRRISEAVTPMIPILLSSRLPYRRRRWQNCNENSHKECMSDLTYFKYSII